MLSAHHRVAGAGARGKRQQSKAAATFTVDDFRGHDLRRTAAVDDDVEAACRALLSAKFLVHAERGVTSVYDRSSYDGEKRAALKWWAIKLQATLENKDSANVIPLSRPAGTSVALA